MNDVLAQTAVEQAALIRDGHVSAREVVTASLARIEQLNPLVGPPGRDDPRYLTRRTTRGRHRTTPTGIAAPERQFALIT